MTTNTSSPSAALSSRDHEYFARALAAAATTKQPIARVSESAPQATIADAYEIQRRWLGLKMAQGVRKIGRKIGLTSRAMQMASNLSEPDYGFLTSDMLYRDGSRISCDTFLAPRLEVELAFFLGSPLRGEAVELPDVLRATEYICPALEIIDYRTQLPRAVVDTIADNAAAAGIVLGGRVVPPNEIDLTWVAATLSRNGQIEESGVSAAVMGHPAAGIVWLCKKLSALGDGLSAGEVVLSGSFTRPVSVAPGDVIHANFGQLGSIGVAFEGSKS